MFQLSPSFAFVPASAQKHVEEGTFDWDNKEHQKLLMAMLMTAADISAIARPWGVQREVAEVSGFRLGLQTVNCCLCNQPSPPQR
jgi:hypothetical protein